MWSWDIPYLTTAGRGAFFYLFLILDIDSRKIVGWEVFRRPRQAPVPTARSRFASRTDPLRPSSGESMNLTGEQLNATTSLTLTASNIRQILFLDSLSG